MYGIFTYICAIFGVNVGNYSIHGAFGHLLTLETTEGESRSGRLAVQGWEVFVVRCGGVRLLSEVILRILFIGFN
jgi:hypothetical protein